MSSDQPKLVERSPTPAEYAELRTAVGWPAVARDAVHAGLAGALYSVCLEHHGRVVGCGRVVGDGGIYFYIQDVIVRPEYQRRGLGRQIMDALMAYLATRAGENSFVGLMAAAGVVEFYKQFGFHERPRHRPGMYRMWMP